MAYIVFEHGRFDYEQENRTVEERIDAAQSAFDWNNCDYVFDGSDGRMMYFYHDAHRCWREFWLVMRNEKGETAGLLPSPLAVMDDGPC